MSVVNNKSIFVCNILEFEPVTQAVADLRSAQKAGEEKIEFLKRQAEQAKKSVDDAWAALWKSLESTGRLPHGATHKDYTMSIVGDGTQIAITKDSDLAASVDEMPAGLKAALLASLIGGPK